MARTRFHQFVYRGRKPLVFFVSSCCALMLAEIAVRILVDVPKIHEISVSDESSPYIKSTNQILGYELKPGFVGVHRNGVTRINSHGHRDRSRELEKPDDVRRVILLGDSVVESVNLLGDDMTINIQLESLFEDGKTEVLNLAVAGYCTRAEAELLRVDGVNYRPDTVVVVFVENDFQNFNPDHSFEGRSGQRPPGVNSLFRHSHVFRLLCVRLNWFDFGSVHRPVNWNQQALGDNNVAEGFALIRELSRSHGFDVIVGIWPVFTDSMVTDQHVMPSDPDHLVAEHLAWNCGFPTFRFSPYFQRDWKRQVRAGKAESPRHFYTVDADSMHPNPRAARIAAEALYSVLTGRQPTERQSASFDAAEIASALGKPREPPDPLLERRPAYAVLLKQNRPQDAVAYLEQLLKDDPSDADAWCLRAGSYGADGDLLQALRCYDRALEIDPKHVEALVWRGVIDYTSGQTDTAIEFLQRALEHAPNHARACFHLGLAYARRSPDRAAIYFQRATELFPTYVEAHHYLGRIYLILNEPEQAEDACLRAIDIEYDNADAHYDLGRSYAMRGLSEQAVQSFTVAIQLSPQFAVAHLALGDAFQRTGDLSSAILHLKQASQLQPTETEAAGRLAWILATAHDDGLRDGPKAVELARHCVARDRNYHTLEILAAALAETGDFESALKYQQQAIEQAPENASNRLRSRLEQYRKNRPLRD